MGPTRSTQANSDSAPLPEIGQPFNPYKRFHGSFIPEQICRYRGLSTGAKLVYGRLYRYAGEDGAAYPSTSALADEVGLGETQVRIYIKELETKRFLRVDRENRRYRPDGSGGSNQYAFLSHEAFIGDAGDLRKAPPPLQKSAGVPPLRKTEGVPLQKTAALTPTETRTRRESLSRESMQKSQSNPDDAQYLPESGSTNISQDGSINPEPAPGATRDCSKKEREWLTDAIGSYGQRRKMRDLMGGEPPAIIVQKCLDAANGGSVRDMAQILRQRCLNGCEPGTSAGPHSWGWFPAVIRDAFSSRRKRAAAPQRDSQPRTATSDEPAATARFGPAWVRQYVLSLADRLRPLDGYQEIVSELEGIASGDECQLDLEVLDERLTALEGKMMTAAHARQSETDLLQIRREIETQLDPYRKKMSQDQLGSLERQFLERSLRERTGLPHLSIFYANDNLEHAA